MLKLRFGVVVVSDGSSFTYQGWESSPPTLPNGCAVIDGMSPPPFFLLAHQLVDLFGGVSHNTASGVEFAVWDATTCESNTVVRQQ